MHSTRQRGALLGGLDRSVFIPDRIWVRGESGHLVPLDRGDDPEGWQRAVAADESVVTAVQETPAGLAPASSSTAPWLMATMLDLLQAEQGMRVLEIGTGTGFNAAALSGIVGASAVTTVEYEPAAAERARSALQAAGLSGVRAVAGDGLQGYAPSAPYDRVIATAAVARIPRAWVEQSRPGARLVVPMVGWFHPDAPLAVLDVRDDGTAVGSLTGSAHFMPAAGHELAPGAWSDVHERWQQWGEPAPERFGIVVDGRGSRVWLDDPANTVEEW